jgi:glycosyltransferase involved in cell wall biosynthesis
MKLSILILTHNRPLLFKRCITSVLNNLPNYDIEILVNNDSNDITEIYNDKVNISYYYENNKKLTDTYKFLYEQSKGEYIFYLEDDDYIKSNFFKYLNFNYDVNFLNYLSKDIITNKKNLLSYYKRFFTKFKSLSKINNLTDFLNKFEPTDFQFSQIVFKKNGIKYWPTEDNIFNDYKIFKSLELETIFYISKPLWVQTTDGEDNISFDTYNKDKRFI